MKRTTRILISIATAAAALAAPAAQADTGSDWLNGTVAQLRQEISLRNALADAARTFQLAYGYGMPDALARRVDAALAQAAARADDNAFALELTSLRHTMQLYALAERH